MVVMGAGLMEDIGAIGAIVDVLITGVTDGVITNGLFT